MNTPNRHAQHTIVRDHLGREYVIVPVAPYAATDVARPRPLVTERDALQRSPAVPMLLLGGIGAALLAVGRRLAR